MVAPSGLPHRVRFLGAWKFTVARIPREALQTYVPMLSDTVGIYSDLTLSERSMMAFMTQAVESDQDASANDTQLVSRTVLEMAGSLVRHRQGQLWTLGTPQAMLIDRALALIIQECGDPELGSERIARSVGVSLRHLQDLFADRHTSIAAEIRRERSRVARSLLQDPRFGDINVQVIAERAGFGSGSSMRRALDALYGLSPNALRKRRAE